MKKKRQTKKMTNPYAALERIFHEPNRLAIMSSLCGAAEGQSFTQLKNDCDLTDGNLSRHLKTLEENSAVRIKKGFVGAKPRTTVHATEAGREAFLEYLKALETVLQRAAESLALEGEAGMSRKLGKALAAWEEKGLLDPGRDMST